MAALLALPALAAEPSIPGAVDPRSPTEKAQAAVSKGVVLEQATVAGAAAPSPSGQAITRSEAQAVDPDGREPLADALACLARTIYWEAKGEDRPGMEAVASVVMNRLGKESFPSTVCGVVTEGSQTGACQFSWRCDGRPDEVEEASRYAITMEVAREALNRQPPDRTDGALYFHNGSVTPGWDNDYIETAAFDGHRFFKPKGRKAK